MTPTDTTPADPSQPGPIGDLAALGWDKRFAAAFAEHAGAGREPVRVIAVHRGASIVRSATGDRPAAVSGRFRFDVLGVAAYPVVGDWVALAPPDETGNAVIVAVLPRRSAIRGSAGADSGKAGRPAEDQVLAANIDLAIIVAGLDGDLNLRRLERYLAVAWSSGAEPLVVLNKADLPGDLAAIRLAVEAIAPGITVQAISARTGAGLDELTARLLPGRTAILLGSSGVGKSTLLNALVGEARQATGAVRGDDSRGRHTTSHRELFALPGGALLIDTPGLRSLDVAAAAPGLAPAFDDIVELAAGCRFADCGHDTEPGCAVTAAVAAGGLAPERLAAHRKLELEAAHVARTADPALMAEERRRSKILNKSLSRQLRHK
jgi:ribosome biogenesis GTPase